MADPFLDGKPVKLSKNGSDVICVGVLCVCVGGGGGRGGGGVHFMTVLAAAFCTANRHLICFWGSHDRRLLQ